jgi:Fuc2NAc and GlcNAc transferase
MWNLFWPHRGNLLAVAVAAFLTTFWLTALIRKIALTRGVLDVPNTRSSHTIPTPRGGGLAVVVTVLLAVILMDALGAISQSLASALLVGGTAVAIVGLVDDLRAVSAPARIVVHLGAFGWCIWLLGPAPVVNFGFTVWNPGALGAAVVVIFLCWFLNLYNFMDGIDGIAGVEAVSVLTFAAILALGQGGAPSTAMLLALAAASVAGFLVWNWPPARIFMGDSGSGFLGFYLGAVAWSTVVEGRFSIWVWLILLGAFVVDATVTLLRRWLRGAKLSEAHRSHAYQRLSRKYGSHLKITLGILGVNVFWLDPLGYLATLRPSFGAVLTSIAWLPLVVVAWRCGAGIDGD